MERKFRKAAVSTLGLEDRETWEGSREEEKRQRGGSLRAAGPRALWEREPQWSLGVTEAPSLVLQEESAGP